jgi:hypothetical protein
VGGEVVLQERDEMRRDRDVSDACIALRLLDDDLAPGPDHGATDADEAELQVDIATPELGKLAKSASRTRRRVEPWRGTAPASLR